MCLTDTNFFCHIFLLLDEKAVSYSMKIKKQTRKLAAGCSKHCFEVVDRTDEVSNHSYGKATLTWFEEIFKEYYFSYKYLFSPIYFIIFSQKKRLFPSQSLLSLLNPFAIIVDRITIYSRIHCQSA